VSGVFGSRLVTLGYSRLKPRQRLHTWIDLLALSAALPDEHLTGHAVGRARAGPQRALSGPLDERAGEWLRQLVELRDLGLTRPLPVPIATGCAWAEARVKELMGADIDPAVAAEREWRTDPDNRYGILGEDADASHVRVFGRRAPVQRLLDDGLAEHAWTIWEPLLTGGERVAAL
jgi:exodeoxyribonuclease V gamma subunit